MHCGHFPLQQQWKFSSNMFPLSLLVVQKSALVTLAKVFKNFSCFTNPVG